VYYSCKELGMQVFASDTKESIDFIDLHNEVKDKTMRYPYSMPYGIKFSHVNTDIVR
jgi:hypothetical protein